MEAIKDAEDRIWEIWQWCSESYLQHGKKIQFPKHTDPKKTYQWRYARALANKLDSWGFDEETSKSFIDIAIKYAKDHGMLNKGMAALHQENMLQICYDKLKNEENSNDQNIRSLSNIKSWLDKQTGQKTLLKTLLKRRDRESFCNLTYWYEASKISPLYLSLSRSCGLALAKLDEQRPDERIILPSTSSLCGIRTSFLKDNSNRTQARRIFGDDWRKLCQ